ncbi:alpha/beta-hydrolase [Setomelanomma holmii]|uniref:Alpha/beta-hydrolase n=1 Tax=Setomelanomma holmii TaxID=210430 RepID=A0A9P4LTL4_9PLEO|nr:alpha/beta-hydrolase [Setomelanomma holmii]
MKSWNGPEADASTSLIAAPSPRSPAGDGIRIRALVATVATCAAIFGIDALFPGIKYALEPGRSNDWIGLEDPEYVEKPFEWSQVQPSEALRFQKCFDEFECAKLKLPLDYFNGTHPDDTISVAVTKLPARVSVNDPRYGGPILINPGGPGGPGAFFAVLVGHSLQNIVDFNIDPTVSSPDARYYDIIGFDPRGIGETTPRAYCVADSAASWSWSLREYTEGILGSSDAALGRLWSMSHAWGASCKQAMDTEKGADIKRYMTTALVARDMLEIVERHATYVADRLAHLNAQPHGCRKDLPTVIKPSEANLDYWGFSYGTYLGSTFASMFPDRVGRVILDAVVSSYDYNQALGNGSLTDNQKAMYSFYTYCVQSGREECPLTTANSTIDDVEERVQSVIESLYHNPLPILTPTGPEILTYSDLKALIFSAVYQPRSSFQLIANILAAIEAGHGSVLDDLARAYRYLHVYSCPVNGSAPTTAFLDTTPLFAVLCSDGTDQTHINIDEFVEYWNLLEDLTPTAGAIWAALRMRCAAWTIKPQYKFSGPFGGNTSHPILFISNTADPVTPLRSGRLMHSFFPNSGLLTVDIAGHCSISGPTLCTLTKIKRYFQTGALPKENTLCVPEPSAYSLNSTDPESPFYDPSLDDANVEAGAEFEELSVEMQELHMAGYDMMRIIAENDLFGVGRISGSGERWKNVMQVAMEYGP